MTDGQGIHRTARRVGHDWTVRTVPETGSTNADMIEAIRRGERLGHTALRADHQTSGRGRLDRRWDAPPGANLLVSICFDDVPANAAVLTQQVGLAAVMAVEAHANECEGLGLKWPNDVMVGDRKLAGILAQRAAEGPVVVGIGLNVGWAPPGAVSVHELSATEVTPATLLDSLLERLDHLRSARSHETPAAFRERLLTLGRQVRIELPGARLLQGTARDVLADGRLIVEADDGQIHTLDVGDVVHLRPNDRPE